MHIQPACAGIRLHVHVHAGGKGTLLFVRSYESGPIYISIWEILHGPMGIQGYVRADAQTDHVWSVQIVMGLWWRNLTRKGYSIADMHIHGGEALDLSMHLAYGRLK